MSAWPLLLRLLLAVALVFNGAAPAVAAVHAGHMAAPPLVAESAPAAEDMPCHEQFPTGTADQAPLPDDQSASADCCKGGACRCACVHSTPVAIIGLGVIAPFIEHAASVRPMSLGHADAALPHLIRPPIG